MLQHKKFETAAFFLFVFVHNNNYILYIKCFYRCNMASKSNASGKPTVIKKYANRRLYDTGRSSYVTLDDLCEMVQQNHDFVVIDAKSGDDITRSVLTQIIADQESEDETLLPTNFMRTLISFYGNNAKAMLPSYLEQTMAVFEQNQERFQEQISKSLEGIPNMENMFPQQKAMEDIARMNMEMYQNALKMMPPFNLAYGADSDTKKKS